MEEIKLVIIIVISVHAQLFCVLGDSATLLQEQVPFSERTRVVGWLLTF
jgi:hypothetical protein